MDNAIPVMALQLKQSDQHSHDPSIPPARVLTAIRFLDSLSAKVAKRVVPIKEWECQIVDGDILEGCEVKAQEAACSMLTAYFRGELGLDRREQIEARALLRGQECERITCPDPRCQDKPRSSCKWCNGSGYCVLFPGVKE